MSLIPSSTRRLGTPPSLGASYRKGGSWTADRGVGAQEQVGRGATERLDVVVLGGGVAGLSAAYRLRDLELEVLDSADHVGGRTRSLPQSHGIWLHTVA